MKGVVRNAVLFVSLGAIAGGVLNVNKEISSAQARCPQIPIVRESCEMLLTPVAALGGFGDGALTGGKVSGVLFLSGLGIRALLQKFPLVHILIAGVVLVPSSIVVLGEYGVNVLAIAFSIEAPSSDGRPTVDPVELFSSSTSLGALAIGHAEGNPTAAGEPTSLINGHIDPGNFKQNMGWCSDQGRGGGDLERANSECLKRAANQLGRQVQALKEEDIDPEKTPEVLINLADLYNQASPWVSENFPNAYRAVLESGRTGVDAIATARTAAFLRTEITPGTDFNATSPDASGLLGICRRENRPISDWECVYGDQLRRTQAIRAVLEQKNVPVGGRGNPIQSKLLMPIQQSEAIYESRGFIPVQHEGIDWAAPEGTPVYAAAPGRVVFAGQHGGGLGLAISILHEDGTRTVYGHLSKIIVQERTQTGTSEQTVQRGDIIASSGNTGNSTGPHLHFEVIDPNGKFIDPRPLLGP